ncbi:MAG: TIM barrel protein [Pseudomonadota bacterium]
MSSPFAIDLHVHTAECTPEAVATAGEMVAAAAHNGLAGLCVTAQFVPDELRQQSAVLAMDQQQLASTVRRGFDAACAAAEHLPGAPKIYFGLEYRIPRTMDDVLVLGLDPSALDGIDLLRADPWDLRRFVVERGGILVAAHPFRHRNHGAPFGGPNLIDAVEVVNGRRDLNNRNDLAARWCQKIDGLALAGSDAHATHAVGEAVTLLPELPQATHALGVLLRRRQGVVMQQRRFLWLGLQSCRFNGLFVEDELRHTSRQGLSAFEVFFDNFMPSDIDARARARFHSMASGMGLQLSVLAPLVSLAGTAGRDLGQELVRFAVDVGACLLVVPALCVDDLPLMQELASRAADSGVDLAIGNGPDYGRQVGPERLARTAEQIPGAQVALDLGYAHLHRNGLDYTEELLQLLDRAQRRIVHLQLHDNDGLSDGHLSLGDGTLPLRDIFERLFSAGFDGAGIVEHWREIRREAQQIRDMVLQVSRPLTRVDLQSLARGNGGVAVL